MHSSVANATLLYGGTLRGSMRPALDVHPTTV
jgi:hypothetical protein